MNIKKINLTLILFLIFFSNSFSDPYTYLNLKINSPVGGELYFSHILILISFIYFFILNLINNKIKINIIFIFTISIITSLIFSLLLNTEISLPTNYIPLFAILLFATSIYFGNLTIEGNKDIDFFLKVTLIFVLIHLSACIYETLVWIANYGFVHFNTSEYLRPIGLFPSPIESLMMLVIGYFLSELLINNKYGYLLKYLFLLFIILSLSRAGFLIGSIIALNEMFKLFVSKKNSFNYKIFFILMFIMFVSFFLIAEFYYLVYQIDIFFIERINNLFNSNLNTQRILIFKKILNDITLSLTNIIFGNGFHTFTFNIGTNYTYDIFGNPSITSEPFIITNPHNSYLSILLYQGFFGLVVYLSFFVMLIIKCLNNINHNNSYKLKKINKTTLILIGIYLLFGFFDTIYVTTATVIIFGMIFSCILTDNHKIGR